MEAVEVTQWYSVPGFSSQVSVTMPVPPTYIHTHTERVRENTPGT